MTGLGKGKQKKRRRAEFFGLHKYQKGRRICKKESRDLAWPTGQTVQSRDWIHNPGRLLCRVAGRDAVCFAYRVTMPRHRFRCGKSAVRCLALYKLLVVTTLPFAPASGHNERRHPLPCRLLENRIAVLSSVGRKPFRGNTVNQRDCLRLFPDTAAK